jgi:hypothetical protein
VKTNRANPYLVVLAGTILGVVVGAVLGYAMHDPCVPDPNEDLSCLFDTAGVDAFLGSVLGFLVGMLASFAGLLWLRWLAWVREQRGDDDLA